MTELTGLTVWGETVKKVKTVRTKMFYVRACPHSGDYSGTSLGVRSVALLHSQATLATLSNYIQYFFHCRACSVVTPYRVQYLSNWD